MRRKETCTDCKFYYSFDVDEGNCCRYPPVLIFPNHESSRDGWSQPTVNEGDWCGEFKAKEETE